MNNFFEKLKCVFTFEEKEERRLSKRILIKEFAGRSMIEVVGVILIMGLLTILALRGIDTAMTKARANKVLDDAADVYAKLSMSKRTHDDWSTIVPAEKSRSGFEFKGMHSLNPAAEEGEGSLLVTYARATIPQSICKHLVDMQSGSMILYEVNDEDEISSTPMSECEEQNDIVFSFSYNASCSNKSECVSKYGSNYNCKNGQCVRIKNYCSSDGACISQYGSNYVCEDDQCVRCEKCNDDSDCPTGYFCSDGKLCRKSS